MKPDQHLMSKRPFISPMLGIVLALFAVSTASIFIRFAQKEAPSLVIAAARLTLATLVLGPIAINTQWREIRALSKNRILLLCLSGIFLAFHFASWISSLEYNKIASSAVLVSTAPLWVALISPLFLHEKVLPIVWIGLGVTLSGLVIVSLGQACPWSEVGFECPPVVTYISGRAFTGNILALIGAFCVAVYLLIGRSVRSTLSLITYTTIVYGMAAIVLNLMVVASGEVFTGYSPQIYFWFLALAIIPQIIGHSTYNWALRYLPAVYVSVVLLGEPVGSGILAFFVLREAPALIEIAGGIVILLGIFMVSKGREDKQLTGQDRQKPVIHGEEKL